MRQSKKEQGIILRLKKLETEVEQLKKKSFPLHQLMLREWDNVYDERWNSL